MALGSRMGAPLVAENKDTIRTHEGTYLAAHCGIRTIDHISIRGLGGHIRCTS
jgi:hypothetical protein